MTELLKSIAGQFPVLVILVILMAGVFYFLERLLKTHSDSFKRLHDEHIYQRKLEQQSMDESTKAKNVLADEQQKVVFALHGATDGIRELTVELRNQKQ